MHIGACMLDPNARLSWLRPSRASSSTLCQTYSNLPFSQQWVSHDLWSFRVVASYPSFVFGVPLLTTNDYLSCLSVAGVPYFIDGLSIHENLATPRLCYFQDFRVWIKPVGIDCLRLLLTASYQSVKVVFMSCKQSRVILSNRMTCNLCWLWSAQVIASLSPVRPSINCVPHNCVPQSCSVATQRTVP